VRAWWGFRFLPVKWCQDVARGEGAVTLARARKAGRVQPLSRQDEYICCTEEAPETLETIMPLGLEQRMDCDVDILYDMD